MPRTARRRSVAGKSTHEELMAACDHRALVAQIVAGAILFYQCHNCAARFEPLLAPYVFKGPVAVVPEAV